jgi:hypothetical protein
MKFFLLPTTVAALIAVQPAFGQAVGQRSQRPAAVVAPPATIAAADANGFDSDNLARFDLDFPGGTAQELVNAIEKASGKPLNIVIALGAERTPLPPLKMRSVTVPELFRALQASSEQNGEHRAIKYGNSVHNENRFLQYTFHTLDKPIRDESVWYFSSRSDQGTVKACRFWQLGPYLENYTVDDITTAIQTGYKMLGEAPPEISFHKDTKLLIAVGEDMSLGLINAALDQLQLPRSGPSAALDGEVKHHDAAAKK